MADTSIEEASLSNNTGGAVKLNPITFDESALGKLLETRLGGNVEEKEPVEAASDEVTETAEDVHEPEKSSDSPEEVVETSQDEESAPTETEESESDGVQKRIDKLTRAKKEANEKLESLERELTETKSKLQKLEEQPTQNRVADVDSPFSNVWDIQKLQTEYEQARQLKRWCEDNADGATLNDKEYSYEEVKAIRRRVEDAIDIQIPQRARFIQEHHVMRANAEKVYPFWKDRSSVEYTEAMEVLREMPSIRSSPDFQMLIGDFIMGRKQRVESSKKSNGKVVPKVAPKQPSIPTTAGNIRVDKEKTAMQAERSNFLKKGGVDELSQLLRRM